MNDSDISLDQSPKTGHNNLADFGLDIEILKAVQEEENFAKIQLENPNGPTATPEIKLYREKKGKEM